MINSNGNYGIGINPSALLHISNIGSTYSILRLDSGNQGLYKVLSSDINGNADWIDASNIPGLVDGIGTTNYAVKWVNGANSTIGDSTWAFSGNNYYPVTNNSTLGLTSSRIGTAYISNLVYSSNFIFYNDNLEVSRFQNSFFGIGTPTPSDTLHVLGSIRFETGNQGLGKVLTSDLNGVASWQTPSHGDITGFGTPNYITKWGSTSSISDGTWAFQGNSIYPVIDGSNIGLSGSNRVNTIFMASNIDYANDLKFISGNTNFTFATDGRMGIGMSPTSSTILSILNSGTSSVPLRIFKSDGITEVFSISDTGSAFFSGGIVSGTFSINQTEIGYLSGLTSSVQEQLNNKLNIGGVIMSPYDKGLISIATFTDGDLASNSGISKTPIDGCYITVYYNGQEIEVGDGVKTKECYFSGDGGVTPKGFSSTHLNGRIVLGDKLYWNNSVSGFNLEYGSRLSFGYLI